MDNKELKQLHLQVRVILAALEKIIKLTVDDTAAYNFFVNLQKMFFALKEDLEEQADKTAIKL